MAEGGENKGRDQAGRFAPGNRGGPGGSRHRSLELRRAAIEAITEEHIQAMIRKAARMGLEGNLAAMRLVFERVCGRAAEAPVETESLPFSLPRIRTAADCMLSLERVSEAVCAGKIDHEAARFLLDMIQARLKAMEVGEFEQRLVEMEKTLESVNPHKKGGR